MAASYVVRVSDGTNEIYYYRKKLYDMGLRFNKRAAKGESFYEKKCEEYEAHAIEKFAECNGLKCVLIPEQYTRSDNYRKEFFKTQKPVNNALYRCAYCGRKFTFQQIQVDHIFPVNGLSYSKSVRKRAMDFGITEANDMKNLCCACKSCNTKKGTKLGMWVIRGFLGRHEAYWKIRHIAKAIMIWLCIMFVMTALKENNHTLYHELVSLFMYPFN